MNLIIPTITTEPDFNSTIPNCTGEAQGFLVYETGNGKITKISSRELSVKKITELLSDRNTFRLNNNVIISKEFCETEFNNLGGNGLELWKCNAQTVRDMINLFVLGGAFLYSKNHNSFHSH